MSARRKATSAIFINLAGGPTHMDTFDLKPDAPAEFRGEFNPIATNVSGIEICEHLPKLAKCADKFAILRGVSHTLAAHDWATKYMNTGNRPLPSLEFPGYGAVVARSFPARLICRRSSRSRTRRRWPATWASSTPRSDQQPRPKAGSRSRCAGSRWAEGLTISDDREAADTC